MPIHDWGRVDAGVFHDFHLGWIDAIRGALNRGLLPEPFYAIAEPVLGEIVPDVLTLRTTDQSSDSVPAGLRHDAQESPLPGAATVVVQDLPPPGAYLALARHIVIRSSLRDDEVVAVFEIVSPANKASREARRRFLQKGLELLRIGVHLAFVDLHAATALVPAGFHALICDAYSEPPAALPGDRPLQAASYQVLEDGTARAHVASLRPGDKLPDLPVFLAPHHYVRLPLEETYMAAFGNLARRFREALER